MNRPDIAALALLFGLAGIALYGSFRMKEAALTDLMVQPAAPPKVQAQPIEGKARRSQPGDHMEHVQRRTFIVKRDRPTDYRNRNAALEIRSWPVP